MATFRRSFNREKKQCEKPTIHAPSADVFDSTRYRFCRVVLANDNLRATSLAKVRHMRPRSLRMFMVAAVYTLAFTPGCDHGDHWKTYPVTGTIAFPDGKRFSGGNQSFIVFESLEHSVNATGVIDADGTFSLGTYEPNDGAVAGIHRVSITPPTPVGDPDQMRTAPLIHPKYRNLDTSELQVTVEAIRSNDIPITVTRAR